MIADTVSGSTSTAVCVTGMHRSGTSLATRALEALGVWLGRDGSLLPPGPDNPAGYFENQAIQELDDELLAHLGGSWDQPPTLAGDWADDPGLDAFRRRAGEVVARDLGGGDASGAEAHGPVGFKDPRLSLLLPFWRTVVPVRATVVLVRAPAQVAGSLARRNQIDPPQAAALWLRYLLAATTNDPEHLLVTQDDFFTELGPTLARLAIHLGLPAPTAAVEAEVADHLDPALQHHDPHDAEAGAGNPLVAMAQQVWNQGRPDPAALDPLTAAALEQGWLRPPSDGQALARARAEAVSFKEQLKRRNEVLRALKEGRPPPEAGTETPVIDVDRPAREPA
jgi:hypothetical protein